MSGVFGYTHEAIRVKARKCEGNQPPELKKFSVDPQITSFEVLQSILTKAFELKGEFSVYYRIYDVNGHETYMPILSDWDLDAAFLKAHNTSIASNNEPYLYLLVNLKPFEECSDDWEIKENVSIFTQLRTFTSQEAKPSPRLHGIFNQMGKTFNMVQRAFNFGEEGTTNMQRPPLSDAEFRKFLDPVGQLVYAKELRTVIYFGGIEPSLRKVVWKHLLNVYPEGMTGRERMDYIKKKSMEYISMRDYWKNAITQCGPQAAHIAYIANKVKKDVLRTDRHHPFYAGNDDNQNVVSLLHILTTYGLNHPKVSYCQGMSDLASPLLVTMNDEAHAYICFCGLMQRLSANFEYEGIAMTQKFAHLAEGLIYYDPEFYHYIKKQHADHLLFCYRWLLLEMKREFAFEDALRMLEVMWSSLPADPPENGLKLYDVCFQTSRITPPISPLLKKPMETETVYTKICELRRKNSSSLNNFGQFHIKRQNHSLDLPSDRSEVQLSIKTKYLSFDDAVLSSKKRDVEKNLKSPKLSYSDSSKSSELVPSPKLELRPRSVSPLEQKSDSAVLNGIHHQSNAKKNSKLSSSMTSLIINSKRSGHFRELKEKLAGGKLFSSLDVLTTPPSIKEEDENRPSGKIVKNLNEFLNFTNRSKISDMNVEGNSKKPKVLLTRSSFDDSESSTCDHNSSSIEKPSLSHTTNSDDTFDETSPDDSQEYFLMTTSVTRELRLELENLDRKVFGDTYVKRLIDSPDSEEDSDLRTENDCTVTKEVNKQSNINENLDKKKIDDVFVWENPLHQASPSNAPKSAPHYTRSPDEQADLDYDAPSIVNELSVTKSVTPVKIISHPDSTKQASIAPTTTSNSIKDIPETSNTLLPNAVLNEVTPSMTNSCEEVTEAVKTSGMLPPPDEFGGGNPFLMFLCLTIMMQHRDRIMSSGMDCNELAMYFDKMVRRHNVTKVLNQARQMYARYMKQQAIAQQKRDSKNEDC